MSELAQQVVEALRSSGQTVGAAESLTGGLLVAALVEVPGASTVVRGGVVAYAPQVKVDVLGVEADVVATRGTVDPQTARQMAVRARDLLGADWGVSTTGVAGPEPSEGKPVGTVHVGVAGPDGVDVIDLALSGTRREIRDRTVADALSHLVARLGEQNRTAAG